jgi:hypothetical protein
VRSEAETEVPSDAVSAVDHVSFQRDDGNLGIEVWGLRFGKAKAIMKPMQAFQNPNSNLPACWIHFLVCPRRYLAVLPSQARPSLFGSD